jgi:hypothetical protein
MPRSPGTKIVLWPGIGDTGPEYAIGVETNNIWFNTGGTIAGYKFYLGSIERYRFDNNNLTLPANPTANMHAATKQYVDANISAPQAWVQVANYFSGNASQCQARSIGHSIQLRGRITYPGNYDGSLVGMGQLPSGLRPSAEKQLPAIISDATGTEPCRCQIQSSGVIAFSVRRNVSSPTFYADGIIIPF